MKMVFERNATRNAIGAWVIIEPNRVAIDNQVTIGVGLSRRELDFRPFPSGLTDA